MRLLSYFILFSASVSTARAQQTPIVIPKNPGVSSILVQTPSGKVAFARLIGLTVTDNGDGTVSLTVTGGTGGGTVGPAGPPGPQGPQGASGSGGSPTTDASQLITGTLPFARLPIGTTANTVPAANDSRIVGDVYQIDPTQSPYYASGQGGTTTTLTAGLTSGSTSATVGSCATMLPNQGLSIQGAGTAGAYAIVKVSSCSGTALTFTPATTTTVSAGAVVKHDETVAFQAAINAFGNGDKTIKPPDGTYLINGPLTDTSFSNSVLTLPLLPLGGTARPSIAIKGARRIAGYGNPGSGVVFKTDLNAGALLSGKVSGGLYGGFISTDLVLENLHFVSTQTNPCLTIVDGTYFPTLNVQGVRVESAAPATPSCTTGMGIKFPILANDVSHHVDDYLVIGFYSFAKFGEHTRIGSVYGANGNTCWIFDNTNPFFSAVLQRSDTIQADYIWSQLCNNMIVGPQAGGAVQSVHIQALDGEATITSMVSDPNNLLRGEIWGHIIADDARSTSTVLTPVIVGAANMRYHNLDTGACTGLNCPSSTLQTATLRNGLIEEWNMQDGSGTTSANSVDSSSPLTNTGVTYASTAGFTGTVATFNGTSSYARTTSSTLLNFDGSTPFSACAWDNPTSVTTGDRFLMGNFDTSNAVQPGWVVEVGYGSGTISAYLSNNVTTNTIFLNAAVGITASANNHICLTYDGSKAAAGTHLYYNGALVAAPTVGKNTLTGAITSTGKFTIGADGSATPINFLGGAIARVKVWNRAVLGSEISTIYGLGPSGF